jgi:hypothetical protein
VAVTMVNVRVVRVLMTHRWVVMEVAMRLARWVVRSVFVLVVFVMNVAVVVRERLMVVFVGVPLNE